MMTSLRLGFINSDDGCRWANPQKMSAEQNAALIEEIADDLLAAVHALQNNPEFRRKITTNEVVYQAHSNIIAGMITMRNRTLESYATQQRARRQQQPQTPNPPDFHYSRARRPPNTIERQDVMAESQVD